MVKLGKLLKPGSFLATGLLLVSLAQLTSPLFSMQSTVGWALVGISAGMTVWQKVRR